MWNICKLLFSLFALKIAKVFIRSLTWKGIEGSQGRGWDMGDGFWYKVNWLRGNGSFVKSRMQFNWSLVKPEFFMFLQKTLCVDFSSLFKMGCVMEILSTILLKQVISLRMTNARISLKLCTEYQIGINEFWSWQTSDVLTRPEFIQNILLRAAPLRDDAPPDL